MLKVSIGRAYPRALAKKAAKKQTSEPIPRLRAENDMRVFGRGKNGGIIPVRVAFDSTSYHRVISTFGEKYPDRMSTLLFVTAERYTLDLMCGDHDHLLAVR